MSSLILVDRASEGKNGVARVSHLYLYPEVGMRFVLKLALLAGLVALPGANLSYAQTSPRTAIVALAQEPDRFYAPATEEGQLVANLVFDPLVGLDDQMNPYPVLAATLPTPENGLVRLSGDGADRRLIVTMPLRQGVTWSDGEPFT